VVTTPQDFENWDDYVDECDSIDLTDAQMLEAKNSFRFLRVLLGEGYLRHAVSTGNPLFSAYFVNDAPLARLGLIEFVAGIRMLESAPNFPVILKKIKKRIRVAQDNEDLAEAISVILVARRFAQAGFQIEFEPKVYVPNRVGEVRPKKPDIKIINPTNAEEIIVEVSRMHASDRQQQIGKAYHLIWHELVTKGIHFDPATTDIMNPRHVLPFARIHRKLSESELMEAVTRIRSLMEQVRATGEFDEFEIPGVIEVGISSYDDHDRAREWAKARGILESAFVEGPHVLADEIVRAKLKMRDKVNQLPTDRPGIIAILANDNLLLFAYDVGHIAAEIAHESAKYPKLLQTIIFHTFRDGRTNSSSIEIGPHTFSSKVKEDLSVEQSLIVRNNNCKHQIKLDTALMIERAFAIVS
jgi:hypothetical protein